MNDSSRRIFARCLPLIFLTAFTSIAHAQWTPPTDEELKMTSQPEVPGAAAVYLFKEEITDDKLHMWSKYVRLKVLTERGIVATRKNSTIVLKDAAGLAKLAESGASE